MVIPNIIIKFNNFENFRKFWCNFGCRLHMPVAWKLLTWSLSKLLRFIVSRDLKTGNYIGCLLSPSIALRTSCRPTRASECLSPEVSNIINLAKLFSRDVPFNYRVKSWVILTVWTREWCQSRGDIKGVPI